MDIEDLLDDELDAQFKKLRTEKLSPEEERAAVDNIAKLMDRKIEIGRLQADTADKEAIRENDMLVKQQQLKEDKKDHVIKNILSGAGIVLPIILTVWGTKVSLEFEKEGTVTTMMGRGFINKLFPKK